MKRAAAQILALVALALPSHGQLVLNFDDLALNNYDPIPASYGDTLVANIADIQYRTLNAGDFSLYESHLEFWNNDYGDLTKVAYPSANGTVGEIAIVPAEGYGVRVVSFEMAGYSHQDRTNTVMRILDGSGNVLLNFAASGSVAIQGDGSGPQHSTFTPNLTFAGAVRLQWGTDWDIGLDNLKFEAVPLSAIPEPSTWALLGLGAAGVLGWRRRRRGFRPRRVA